MTLVSQITAAMTAIGTQFKNTATDYNAKIGDLATLTTTAKTSAVAAINEVKSGLGGGGIAIDDGTPGSSTTAYSASKIESLVSDKVVDTIEINGYALDGDIDLEWTDFPGLIPTSALPPLAINETFIPADQTAMLALTAQRGDMAIRTDNGLTYILSSDSPTTLADWKLITAAGSVTAVAGKTGNVSLVVGDISGAQVAADIGSTSTDFAAAFTAALT